MSERHKLMPADMPDYLAMTGRTGQTTFANDLLRGAAEISEFFYGSSNQANRKRIYHLVEQGKFPAFRMGAILCARKSTIIDYVERQERQTMSQIMLHGTAGKNWEPLKINRNLLQRIAT